MTPDEIVAAEVAKHFAPEASAYVAQINRGLLELETGAQNGRREELLRELRRFAHSLKGAAGFTPHVEIVERVHDVETLLETLAGGAGDTQLFNAVYAHLDAILHIIEAPVETAPALVDAPAEESVRVPTRKLDALMSLIGEILVARVRGEERLAGVRQLRETIAGGGRRERVEVLLRETLHGVTTLQRELERDAMQMLLLTDDLQNEIKRVRMQPIGVLFEGFRRTVRDLALRHSRQVRVVIEGESSEVDKSILEELREPLLHLIRNAIDHGLEPAEERSRHGKDGEGTLTLRASTRAQSIIVEVEDDGRGLDYDSILRTARARQLLDDGASEDELAQVVFLSGFSTRGDVGELSGRGVGLDAVREKVHRLEGEITVASRPGRGTTFTLTLPLTLSTSRGLLLRAGEHLWALPFATIQRIVRIEPSAIQLIDGHEAVIVDGRRVGLIRLAAILGFERASDAAESEKVPVVILTRGGERLAIAVDGLVGEQEMVVKSLGHHLRRVQFIAGAALLGSGDIVPVLHPSDLFSARAAAPRVREKHVTRAERGRILVVDDSITTRTLEKGILETAGYYVRTAKDGREAIELLEQSVDDAVISDVNMPRMDGIALVREMRSRAGLRDVPVVLVTSLASEKDRQAGLESGANAYIVKTEFDQTRFLETLRSVIG